MKKCWLGIALLMLFSMACAQKISLSPKEKQRIKLLKEFAQYLKQPNLHSIDSKSIRNQFLAVSEKPDSISAEEWTQQQASLDTLLKVTGKSLGSVRLEEYDVVPWLKFSQPDLLPRMIWEAPAIENIMGQRVPAPDLEKEKAAGKRQQENTLVIYKKTAPDSPLYYVLFDEKGNKIVSWLLLKQGDYHYFLGY